MADYAGVLGTSLNDQAGTGAGRYTLQGVSATASATRIAPPTGITGIEYPGHLLSGSLSATADNLVKTTPVTDYAGVFKEGPGAEWFEKLLAYPSVIELGNILTITTRDIEIYNSFRDVAQTLSTATNNAGTGISFDNLPTLPATIPPNNGRIFQVVVSTQGQPTIDGTLDFTTSLYPLSIAITGTRVVMMAWEPHGEIQETLEFLTDILRSANGKEQRIRVRNYPRQVFDLFYHIPEGEELRKLEAFLYKWHPQTFGVPVWFEAKKLTAAATTGDTTLYLPTSYADFREGSLLIVWSDYKTYDALEIGTINANSIVTTSGVTRDYPRGAKVMPLRTAITKQEISGDKYPVNLHTVAIKFYITDNEVDIGSTAGFSSYNSKVMFDDPNWIPRETNTDTLKNNVHSIDNLIGSPIQFSDWVNSHFISSKGFFCRNPQKVWEMRQVLHALAGRQKSFYLPTFYNDMVVVNTLTNGTDAMDIENISYTDFVNATQPNKSLYIVLNDGTIITREVQSASVIDATTERLIVDANWPYDILPTDIRRISYLRLGRFARDEFEINHNNAGQATLKTPVQGVIQ